MKLKRTIKCGELREEHINKEHIVTGWVHRRRDLGGLIFIDLRDVSGIVQIVLNPEDNKLLHEKGENLRSEDVIGIKGQVTKRESPNKQIPTGEIEIIASDIEIFSKADVLPFSVEEHRANASEELRLKYRYIDLRRDELKNNIVMRSKIMEAFRKYLYYNDFIDIETPTLFKSTPEGARDFLVPSRLKSGEFYALTQSPQIMKQILMISGFDRYFQFARCYRDEDLRADRQYEFTQVDIEMSFADMDDVIHHSEQMMKQVMKDCYNMDIKTPFLRLTYADSMERFGNDKPDMRFGMELKDLKELAEKSSFKVFSDAILNGGKVAGICVDDGAEKYSRKNIEELQSEISVYGAKGLAWVKFTDNCLTGGISKFLNDNDLEILKNKFNLKNNDLLLFVADKKKKVVYDSLANLRLLIGKQLNLYDENERNFLWVTHAPLVEYDEEENRYVSVHHPFTRPNPDDIEYLDSEPDKVTSLTYDMILNGNEIAGGSIRIHEMDVQKKVFKQLGFDEKQMQEEFGFLLDAYKYGAPPHGGIAFGLARVVMLLQNCKSLRDVISFPKTTSGQCPLSGAPTKISQAQLAELKLQMKNE